MNGSYGIIKVIKSLLNGCGLESFVCHPAVSGFAPEHTADAASVVFVELDSVSLVFRSGYEPEVFDPVVMAAAVDVVDLHFIRNGSIKHLPYYGVGRVLNAVYANSNVAAIIKSASFFASILPVPAASEPIKRLVPLFPYESAIAVFKVIRKSFAHVFNLAICACETTAYSPKVRNAI